MDKKLLGVALLFIFLAQMMGGTESRICKLRSQEFRGRCIRRSHVCRIICMHEGFQDGKCERGRCYCFKPCVAIIGGGGGGGGDMSPL
ncbi:hypothetical protein ACP275_10G131700 [Erythranthe tilingii]